MFSGSFKGKVLCGVATFQIDSFATKANMELFIRTFEVTFTEIYYNLHFKFHS